MGIRRRRFHWLKPGTLNNFKVRAISGGAASDWAEIELLTSGFMGMTWPRGAKIKAKPVFWGRCIVVKWTLMREPLRMDFYRLFRKPDPNLTAPPTPEELADNSTKNPFWVKDTGRWAYHTDHLVGRKGLSVDWGEEIELEMPYHYWVWAFDKGGLPSADYLGPDYAEFGKPPTPTLNKGKFTTQVHDRFKWICDFTIAWGGYAEYYITQRKLSALPLWGPPHIVEHDDDAPYQTHTFENLICGKDYDFRVKAVNVPIVLVSDWGEESATTGQDQTRPDEIKNVAGRRLFVNMFRKGEHIKITWDRPAFAIVDQQIESYRIYRLRGTDVQAIAYQARINNSKFADDEEKPEPYSESSKFGGTFFIDDEIEATGLDSGDPVATGLATCTFEAPTDSLTVDGVPVAGTLQDSAVVSSTYAQQGTYSLKCPSTGEGGGADPRIEWSTATAIDFNEGYVTFYFRTSNFTNAGALPILFSTMNTGGDYLRLLYNDDRIVGSNIRLWVERQSGAQFRRYIYEQPSEFYPALANTWVKVDFYWNAAGANFQRLRIRVNDGTWKGLGTETLTVSSETPTGIRFGDKTTFSWYFDNLKVYKNWEGTATIVNPTIYYHYWVTAVDAVGLESEVTGPNDDPNESYDKVTFSKPPSPQNVQVTFNTTLNILSVKLMAMKVSWDKVDEATHHRVGVRVKPKGRDNWSKWLVSPYMREERIDDPDGAGKFYVYPFPLLQTTEINVKVSSWNAAGESKFAGPDPLPVGTDGVKPSEIKNVWGRCYGMYSLLLQKMWIGTKLTWDDLPAYEGIRCYRVFIWDVALGDWDWVGNAHPTIGKLKVHFWDPGPPVANSHKYKIVAVDWDENETDFPVEITVNWLQWWKLASR